MKKNLYVIKDLIADDYGPIFEAKNHGVAVRFKNQQVDKAVGNPAEFKLFHVGEINNRAEIQAVIPREITFVDLEQEKDEK